MIYFDNGATTLQKPPGVGRAMEAALYTCANPGRSGHRAAMRAAGAVFACRERLAAFFGVERPERVVFTHNCTHALNLAIKSLLRGGGHAVISGYEHNSVVRPLEAMKEQGVRWTAAHSPLFEPDAAYEAVEAAITDETRCVILNHVSNVFGFVQPLERVDALCARRGIPLVVDAAQSAGVVPLKVRELHGAAFVCMPGHKALYGPQGTGVLICCKDDNLYSLIEGGTGSNSLDLAQPDFLPDIFESGTLNVPGIAGLCEGVRFVESRGEGAILNHERRLTALLADGLAQVRGVEAFYHPRHQAGVLSFVCPQAEPEAVAQGLAQRDICVRTGLHCAPLAHKSAGTLPQGTVRVSFSAFNTEAQVRQFLRAIADVLRALES